MIGFDEVLLQVELGGRRQPQQVDDQGRAVVVRLLRQCGGHQVTGGLLGCCALGEQGGDPFLAEHAVDAVGAEQVPVVGLGPLDGVVGPDLVLGLDRAGEDMLEPRLADIVGGGQPLQAAVAQPVDAGVADMDEVSVAAAQDQRGKRAGHAAVAGIDLALRVDPAVDGPEASRGGVPHAQDVGQAEITHIAGRRRSSK